MKGIYVFVLLLIGLVVSSHQVVTNTEFKALYDLYTSTSGPKWTNNTRWLNGDPCSNPFGPWFGVSCSFGTMDHIMALTLEKNNLDGTLPTTLGRLFALTNLSLTTNNISSTIPSQLNELGALTHLDLSDNVLSGSIPSQLGDLAGEKSLKYLDFNTNRLSGLVPEFFVTDKAEFTFVNLSNNLFSCPIPAGAEYTSANCLQNANISHTTTTCFNNPFTTTDVSIIGSGFSQFVGASLSCFFQFNGGMVSTTAIIVSSDAIFCPQPSIPFSGCTGQRNERMIGKGSLFLGLVDGDTSYNAVSNYLPINILNPTCSYGYGVGDGYATVPSAGGVMVGCVHPRFPVYGDALLACEAGNELPYRCPPQQNRTTNGLAVFDVNCTSSTCMWAPLQGRGRELNSSFIGYCPYFDYYSQKCSTNYYSSSSATAYTSNCVKYHEQPQCNDDTDTDTDYYDDEDSDGRVYYQPYVDSFSIHVLDAFLVLSVVVFGIWSFYAIPKLLSFDESNK